MTETQISTEKKDDCFNSVHLIFLRGTQTYRQKVSFYYGEDEL